jgi:chromosome segregation ATPase
MSHRITAVSVDSFKRIKSVEISPPADASLILIGGKNAAGKSSLLDALTAALGGGKTLPAEPIHRGAKEAEIVVEFDGGKLVVRRKITKKGSSLEVRTADGAVKSPQAMLDQLVAARFLDPLQFLALPAKEQRAALMKLIPDAARIADLDAKRVRAFERRTEIGRDLTKAEGELARLPEVQVGTPIDVAALNAERAQFAELQRAGDGLGNAAKLAASAVGIAEREVGRIERVIEDLERQLDAERRALETARREHEAAVATDKEAQRKIAEALEAWSKTAPRRTELDEQLAKASDHNRAVYAAETQMARRTEAMQAVDKLTSDRDACTKAIEACDERKAALLVAAKLPVEGLAVTDDGVELNGVPFAQASAAERLRVSLALAIAASPELDDIWVRDAALLDEDSLKAVEEQARAAGKRAWLEVVGARDPGTIVIADGEIKEILP